MSKVTSSLWVMQPAIARITEAQGSSGSSVDTGGQASDAN
jgi:hypothetical protein